MNKNIKKNKIQIIEEIKQNLIKDKNKLNEAFLIDKKQWEIEIKFEKIIEQIELVKRKEFLLKLTKEEIIDGIGKIALVEVNNPYKILNFVVSCIYTNNKVEVFLEKRHITTNKAILEIIKETIQKLKLPPDTVEFKEKQHLSKIVEEQEKFDLIYYVGNKENYLNFIKRLHVETIYENFGEIDVYIDSKDFKEEFMEMDKFAYYNGFEINYYTQSLEETAKSMNYNNNINKISAIFTKEIDNAYEFIKNIKSENIYINVNPCDYINYDTKLDNLVYSKKIFLH